MEDLILHLVMALLAIGLKLEVFRFLQTIGKKSMQKRKCIHDKQQLFELQEKPEDTRFSLWRDKMAQVLVSLVYICGVGRNEIDIE